MAALSAACLDHGLITFVFGNRINVAPPLNLSDAEAADGLAILDNYRSQMTRPRRRLAGLRRGFRQGDAHGRRIRRNPHRSAVLLRIS